MQTESKTARTSEDKRYQEKIVVGKMILIYCRGHKHATVGLCHECQKLLDYASLRIERCPFMETKTFCSNCQVHCYQEHMRSRIREVMRYSGPQMLFHHPILAIRHLVEERRDKRTERGHTS
ncbi:MAG: nitrous oxide-stimulated promoter family protein [Limnochordia bacterium]|jgi:hypothetical protein|nr:nitrous oxide-stimulated promoter family protein [Limnochordia bacterium]